MHRWHFQRLTRSLIPLLLLVTLLCVVMVKQQAVVGSRAFVDDEAYGHLVVARNILSSRTYGYEAQKPLLATRDALWRLALAAVTAATRDPMSASLLLSAACAVLTLLMLLKLARLLFPFPPFILYAAVLMIVSPRFLLDVLSGTPAPLASCLVVGACLVHIEGLQARRPLLSTYGMLLIALAMWIRVEFVCIWLVMWLHAFVLSFIRSREAPQRRPSYVAARGIMGALVFALCMLPLVGWNAVLAKVPWPREIGAPLALDAWATQGPAEAGAALGQAITSALPNMYGQLYDIPFLQSGWTQLVFWFGVVVLTALSSWRREERPFTLVVLFPLVLPLLFGVISPYLGTDSVALVYGALQPLVVMVAAFGFFRIPFLLEGIYRKYREGLPAAMGFNTWWITVGSLFLLLCLFHSVRVTKAHVGELARRTETRQQLAAALEREQLTDVLIATDSPGWLCHAMAPQVLDLTGEASIRVLMCVDSSGDIDPDRLTPLLEELEPAALMIDREEYLFMEGLVQGARLYTPAAESGEKTPLLMSLRGTGGS